MTILCWTPDDVNPMLEMWKGDTGYTDDQINFVNFSVAAVRLLLSTISISSAATTLTCSWLRLTGSQVYQ